MRIELGGSSIYDLQRLGQSTWLEWIHPSMLVGSQLNHIVRDGITGIDFEPDGLVAAFAEDAPDGGSLTELRTVGAKAREAYEHLRVEDVRRAADHLRRIYNTSARDGYACVDLSPALAHDVEGTESEALRLWDEIERPNVMIKVPATHAGLIAVRRLIAAGINVNATQIVGVRRYREVTEAYLSGLEDRLAKRLPLDRVASVASVCVSHIDAAVDGKLDAIHEPAKAANAKRLHGRAAIAVAQCLYQRYKSVIASARWRSLATHHAQTQRLLWASTETNDASCATLKYVNALIGRDTVTAMSPNTLKTYLDHGAPMPALERNLHEVLALFGELEILGINLDHVSTQLQSEETGEIVASPRARPRNRRQITS